MTAFKKTSTALALALMAGPALAASHSEGEMSGVTMGYALADDGMTLVTMKDITKADEVKTYELSEAMRAIAYRPVTGELLGFADGMVYSIDPMSGEVMDLGASFMDDAMIGEGAVAFDFNNQIDAVRAVGADGSNLVYFPDGFGDGDEKAGSVRRFTDAFYVEGDVNAGETPMIFANAYTNAINGGVASSTAQYALDAQTDSLVKLANNAGELTTVGALTVDGEEVDVSYWGGFDIVSASEGMDEAYAVIQLEGEETAGLYGVDLETGALTSMADLGMGGFSGFAVSSK